MSVVALEGLQVWGCYYRRWTNIHFSEFGLAGGLGVEPPFNFGMGGAHA